jgi:hypothetical protein
MLILSDFTRLAAYNSSGLMWLSRRVCHDGLKVLSVNNDTIEGAGYDPTNSISSEAPFAVDLKTGTSLFRSPKSMDGNPIW